MNAVVKEYFKDMSSAIRGNVSIHFFDTGDEMSDGSKSQLRKISDNFDAFVSIERPSITHEGTYMTMRAIDISHLCAHIDHFIYPQVGQAKFNKKQALISIGDGGNEVGMGKVQALVKAHIVNGEKICANTTCDHLIVADTSNFGAYALIAGIIVELINIERKNKKKFLSHFPTFLSVTLENLESKDDLVQLL